MLGRDVKYFLLLYNLFLSASKAASFYYFTPTSSSTNIIALSRVKSRKGKDILCVETEYLRCRTKGCPSRIVFTLINDDYFLKKEPTAHTC
jgi:hypothetical protein